MCEQYVKDRYVQRYMPRLMCSSLDFSQCPTPLVPVRQHALGVVPAAAAAATIAAIALLLHPPELVEELALALDLVLLRLLERPPLGPLRLELLNVAQRLLQLLLLLLPLAAAVAVVERPRKVAAETMSAAPSA